MAKAKREIGFKKVRTEVVEKYDEQTRTVLLALRLLSDIRLAYLGLKYSSEQEKEIHKFVGMFFLSGKKYREIALLDLKRDPIFKIAYAFAPQIMAEQKKVAAKIMEKRKKVIDDTHVNTEVDTGTGNVNNPVDTPVTV